MLLEFYDKFLTDRLYELGRLNKTVKLYLHKLKKCINDYNFIKSRKVKANLMHGTNRFEMIRL